MTLTGVELWVRSLSISRVCDYPCCLKCSSSREKEQTVNQKEEKEKPFSQQYFRGQLWLPKASSFVDTPSPCSLHLCVGLHPSLVATGKMFEYFHPLCQLIAGPVKRASFFIFSKNNSEFWPTMKINWLFSCQLAETRHILYSPCFGEEHCKYLFPIIGPIFLGYLV